MRIGRGAAALAVMLLWGYLGGGSPIASELMAAGRATAYEVRVPQGARDVRAVAINTTDGRREPVSEPPATSRAAHAVGLPRLGGAGSARLLSVACAVGRRRVAAPRRKRQRGVAGTVLPGAAAHRPHTATESGTEAGETDPAAIVRAIYRYHAVDLGFGDIGYQLLVDQHGCVYEGRYSGPDALPVCPGEKLYARLPELRNKAASPLNPLTGLANARAFYRPMVRGPGSS